MKNGKVWIALALAAALVTFGVWVKGLADQPVLQSAKADASAAASTTAAVQAARTIEHKIAASDAAASMGYQKGLEDGKAELQTAIDRLRAAIRLRDQQLAAAHAGNLPQAGAGTGRRDASAPADFLAAHGEDALRLAAEADDVVRQLSACQVILGRDRGL